MGNKPRPPMLVVAAAVLALEAVALLAYTVLNIVDIATNNSYQASNGAALIILQVIMLAGLLCLAYGVLRLRPWTRTPSVMVQVLIGVVGVILLQAHQYEAGVPALILAAAGLVGLLTPASLKALARPMPEQTRAPGPKPGTGTTTPKKPGTTAGKPGTTAGKPGTTAGKPGTTAGKPGTGKGKSGNPAKRNPAGKSVSRP